MDNYDTNIHKITEHSVVECLYIYIYISSGNKAQWNEWMLLS